ncbi:beta-lactamase family protein [Mycolicibacterium fluoranthenivorans]|uniref:Beta-lactamase family protein n=1 Tax=Mycolicibacterium fluoranthenivorans TaxID=258505 RepID=A0A7G8PB38_9MYCO|nr:serine hydrolase domain-containing protein [Mycolicibacterium fluoranthenivorans]QNJ91554.1 beta-lactamase family protein [Mycolicibacterium fluoranthenivorans]
MRRCVARICATLVLVVAAAPACARVTPPPQSIDRAPSVVPDGPFAPVIRVVNDAIAAHRMPGAVVQIGHAGTVVFQQAFGWRKLPGEPGLDGSPSPGEPMTTDTIFDLASLTKPLSTTVAFLQLYDRGLVKVDEPVEEYLPEFNPTHDPRRAQVTLRMLLTHTSGTGGDLSRQGPWGLTAADKADGLHRALTSPLEFGPGEGFHYSDINFLILGALIEKITRAPLDTYVQDHVFAPLGLADTRYLPATKACGPHEIRGTAVAFDPKAAKPSACPPGTWSTDVLARVAPTAHDDDTPGVNPDFGHLLRGTVHDPTARRMGGVAGSAGVFTTAHDVGRYAQALIDRLAERPSDFPLSRPAAELMTTPQQPGHTDTQLDAAREASRKAIEESPNTTDPLLAPRYPAIAGQDLRGFGWDIDTELSKPRGMVFPIGSFGHGGFTGVTLWIDPGSDTYVAILANVIHQPGGPPIVRLSGDVATLAARVLRLYGS